MRRPARCIPSNSTSRSPISEGGGGDKSQSSIGGLIGLNEGSKSQENESATVMERSGSGSYLDGWKGCQRMMKSLLKNGYGVKKVFRNRVNRIQTAEIVELIIENDSK